MELLMLLKDAEPVALRRLRPGTPVDLETICLKCLQKQPEKRYATAGELEADLRRFLNGEPIVARPVGRMEQIIKWAKRKPGFAALSASLATIVLLSVIALTALYVHAESQRKLAEKERSLATSINHFFLEDVVGRGSPKVSDLERM